MRFRYVVTIFNRVLAAILAPSLLIKTPPGPRPKRSFDRVLWRKCYDEQLAYLKVSFLSIYRQFGGVVICVIRVATTGSMGKLPCVPPRLFLPSLASLFRVLTNVHVSREVALQALVLAGTLKKHPLASSLKVQPVDDARTTTSLQATADHLP